jgi:hypothetical protein
MLEFQSVHVFSCILPLSLSLSLTHSMEAGASTLPAPFLSSIFFFVLEGVGPSTRSNSYVSVVGQEIR